jgi:hypothetical protein
MIKLTRNAIDAITKGKIFKVQFIKKNGDLRDMVCRLNVKKGVKGKGSSTAHIERLMTVFDMQKGQFRCVDLNTVKHFKCGDVEISE